MNYNPFLPEVKDNPYPYYQWLRDHAPVYKVEPLGFYAVSRYEDVQFVLKNHALFSSEIVGKAGLGGNDTKTIISCDPPDHTRLRTIVNRGFTPRVIADWEPRIKQIVDTLIHNVPREGEFDLIAELAMPLPVRVIAEMLGVEPERQTDFKHWSDIIVNTYGVGHAMTPEERTDAERELERFQTYFRGMMARRRIDPGDDLISTLVQAESEDDRLSADEVMAFTALLLVAGNETTTNLIGNAVIALLENPDQLRKVVDDPSLVPNMVEEALRYDAPVQLLFRQAMEDVEVAGTVIPKGAAVLPLFASANRDERKYPQRRQVRRHARHAGTLRVWAGHPLLPGRTARAPRGEDGVRAVAAAATGDGADGRANRARTGVHDSRSTQAPAGARTGP